MVAIVEGAESNLKITDAADLARAERLIGAAAAGHAPGSASTCIGSPRATG